MGLPQENLEIAQGSIRRMDVGVVGDIVAVIAPGRWAERERPHGSHTQILQIVQLVCQAGEIAHAVAGRIVERPHMNLINDRVLEPKWVVFQFDGC